MIRRITLLALLPFVLMGNIPRGGSGSDNGGYAELTGTGIGNLVIDSQSKWHGFIGLSEGDVAGDITTHAGTRVDLTGATFASASGGTETQITGVTHGLSLNDYVTITGSSDAAQNAVAQVTAVGSSTDFTVDVAFSSDPVTEGFVTHPDHIEIGHAGIYMVTITQSGTGVTGASTALYAIFDNKNMKHQIRRKYANAVDQGAHAITGLVNAAAGDELWIAVQNTDNANDLAISETSFVVVRVW